MIFKEFQNKELSTLGFGAMRMPTINGEKNGPVDLEKTAEMVDYLIHHGVNYFDTAYGYHGGDSERAMGKILAKYPRDSFYLATKFPGYDPDNMDKVAEIFEEQLRKCGVDYFDFYLLHNVYEKNIDGYLNPDYGIVQYLLQQKQNGRIKHLGFSTHGRLETMERFLTVFGDQMEFCQLQVNYLDWLLQDAKAKVALLDRYQIPVWVMEPLRGGRLASLSDENTAALQALRPKETAVAWSFRFLQSLPSVTLTLSGMSTMEQVRENIATYETNQPLNQQEMETILQVADSMMDTLPCTACRYCVTRCPQGLDIPMLLSLYNDARYDSAYNIIQMAIDALDPEHRPSACIGCKSCEVVCPQQIEIAAAMTDFTAKLH